MLNGNKGEWSEIYTLFKLLADKEVYGGDANLNKKNDLIYPIIKILRNEQSGNFEYRIEGDTINIVGRDKQSRVPINIFKTYADSLFNKIRNANGVFNLPDIEAFMASIYCLTLKAKSQDKTDINIVVHDLRTGFEHLLGFSIKSKLGSPSTLLNASESTNFIYQINGIDKVIAEEFNQLRRFSDKFELLDKHKAKINFVAPTNGVFKNNLMYVDYCLSEIIGKVVLAYYSQPISKVSDIVKVINDENFLDFDYTDDQNFYEHKVKRFLTDVALGLKPSHPWRGKYEATGGYLIVKEDGDVLCYHIYDKNQFEDYLFNNTKLDTPSTSRHQFGNISEENGKYFIKLNLQIRFL